MTIINAHVKGAGTARPTLVVRIAALLARS
jgi:hypothetical protein